LALRQDVAKRLPKGKLLARDALFTWVRLGYCPLEARMAIRPS
jgi:hypothetical protein